MKKDIKNLYLNIKSKIYDFFFDCISKYLTYLQHRMILKKKIIVRIKHYFSKNLKEINYITINPSFKVKFKEDEINFLNEPIHCSKLIKKRRKTGYMQNEAFLCKFKDIKFFAWSGCFTYKNLAITESTINIQRLIFQKTVDSFLFKHRKMKGIYTSVIPGIFGVNNYYHFLIDSIPRLYTISKIEEKNINLIVPKELDKNFLDIIKIFLDERFKIIPIHKYEVWNLESFYFPSFWTGYSSGYLPKVVINYIKNKINNSYNINGEPRNKRIFISRKYNTSRRLKNEEEFFKLLKKYNFNRIHAEVLSHKEQVKYFASAEIIISIHGAGLSNLIFSDNCKVLELFPPKIIKTNYFMLSKAVGLKYFYLIGHDQTISDFKVDIKEAEKKIIEMIEE